jgi:hypothetical protein
LDADTAELTDMEFVFKESDVVLSQIEALTLLAEDYPKILSLLSTTKDKLSK